MDDCRNDQYRFTLAPQDVNDSVHALRRWVRMRDLYRPEQFMPITEKQRRHLKKLAHHLNPVVIVGQHGLTENVLNETALTLETHELIKMRVNAGDRRERAGMIAEISEKTGAELVQTIGHVAVFFLSNPEKPKIRLPG